MDGVLSVIQTVNNIVRSDGKHVQFESYEPGKGAVIVRYASGKNDDCPECVPARERVRLFLSESLLRHGPAITNVRVMTD